MIEVITSDGEVVFVDWSPPPDLDAIMQGFEFDGLPEPEET